MVDGDRVDGELRRAISTIAPRVDEADAWLAIRRSIARDRRRVRVRRLATAGVAVVAVAAIALVVAWPDTDGRSVVTQSPSTVAPPEPTVSTTAASSTVVMPSGWSRRTLPGIHALSGDSDVAPIVEPIGRQVFVWTSTETVVDPDTGNRRVIASPPIERADGASAVWTGTELVIWGGRVGNGATGDGAAYDPATDRWRRLPAAPIAARAPLVAVWTGEEVIYWGDQSRRGAASARDGAAYDPAENSWRKIADAPLGLDQGTGVFTGDELVVVASALDGNNWAETPTQMLAYHVATDRWETGPPPPLSPQAPDVVWSGVLVGWDYELNAVRFDAARRMWVPLAQAPLRFQECYPHGASLGSIVVLIYCGQLAALDMTSMTWSRVADFDERLAGVTFVLDGELVILGDSAVALTPP